MSFISAALWYSGSYALIHTVGPREINIWDLKQENIDILDHVWMVDGPPPQPCTFVICIKEYRLQNACCRYVLATYLSVSNILVQNHIFTTSKHYRIVSLTSPSAALWYSRCSRLDIKQDKNACENGLKDF